MMSPISFQVQHVVGGVWSQELFAVVQQNEGLSASVFSKLYESKFIISINMDKCN